MRYRAIVLALALLFGAWLTSCGRGGRRTLFVSADLATCPNPGHGVCLQARFDPAAEWQPLYGNIAGLDYEEGYAYELLVEPAEPGLESGGLALIEVVSKRFVRSAAARAIPATADQGPIPDALTSRAWVLETMSDAGQPRVPLPGTRITALFGANGRLMGSTGCHGYLADYVHGPGTLRMARVEMLRSSCAWALAEQGDAFADVLRSVAGYRIQGDRLVIWDGDGREALSFRAASADETSAPPGGDPADLTMGELLEAEYLLHGAALRLVNGQRGEQALPDGTRIPDVALRRVAFGDLDGDGAEDAAVELLDAYTSEVGAAYVVAVLNRGGQPVPVASHMLGAPALVKSLLIKDGRIEATLLEDPLGGGVWCCPQRDQLVGFLLVDGELIRLTPVLSTAGQLSINTGVWRLAGLGDPSSLTLPAADLLARFDKGSLSVLLGDREYPALYQLCGETLCISRTAPAWRALNAGPAVGASLELLQTLERAERFSVSADELRIWTRDGQLLLFYPVVVPDAPAGMLP